MIITEQSIRERLDDHEIRSEYGAETLKYDVAAALVAARKMNNLTRTALATMAGVSPAYIAKVESGEANPSIGRIGAILASMWLKTDLHLAPLVQKG
jgi:DNA-binding XRE family transcriptional regulator